MNNPKERPALETASAEASDSQDVVTDAVRPLRKFAVTVQPGRTEYRITHDLQSEDVIVQTRIAGRIREGGISVLDANTVQLTFGGVLNESMQVVISAETFLARPSGTCGPN